jgi:hypothetical protein
MSSTQNSKITANYDYHISDQITTVTQVGTALDESVRTSYDWDGLALIRKSTGMNALRRTEFIREPAVTGDNPILATNKNDTNLLFNDMLGRTLGTLQTDTFNSFKQGF